MLVHRRLQDEGLAVLLLKRADQAQQGVRRVRGAGPDDHAKGTTAGDAGRALTKDKMELNLEKNFRLGDKVHKMPSAALQRKKDSFGLS